MSFIDFARAHGVEIDHAKLYPSDRIKRTGTVEKPKSGNGAYFWNGQRGWVMDWSGEARVIWYEDPHAKPWTDDEKRAWMEKRRSQQTDQQQKYDQVATQAEMTLKSAKIDHHNYLAYKGFKEEKGLVLDNKLLIPMRNVVSNKLQGYQQIYWNSEEMNYEKKMLFGMRAKNSVFYIGGRAADESWLVEGFATGLSLHQALRSCGLKASVVVCFSASNLVQVADQIPNKRFIFADNDASQTGQKVAESTGLPWTMADEEGWDANDLHTKKGLFNVVAKIMELKKKVLTSA
jgi:putative DNA primase/helicase